ncbi:translesion DNA synthesis-associated protein ImuA [Massilia aerilata]|uniref:Translesion DNA synthesis-associated protein ImuA n=1 Tax=Massilia aerilata TaxID=453817 RepID=A0ABW0S0J9_9BURK
MPRDNHPPPEEIHPSLWRASQLARSSSRCHSTGWAALDGQLPGGGWPISSLIELHTENQAVGAMRLLKPVLSSLGKKRVMLIQPPHVPNALALAAMGLDPAQVIWVQPEKTADALWAAEAVLRSGGMGAVLLWQTHARNESLRRLNLASQDGSALFYLFRPLASAQDASPAPLRLALRSAPGGVMVEFVKRKGPIREAGLLLPLSPSFVQSNAPLDRPTSSPAPARSVRAAMVE